MINDISILNGKASIKDQYEQGESGGSLSSLTAPEMHHKEPRQEPTQINASDVTIPYFSRCGAGGTSVVYKGLIKDREVAVKRFASGHDKDYRIEKAVLSSLDHPNIIDLLHYTVDPYDPLLILELSIIGTMERYFSSYENISHERKFDDCIKYFTDIFSALVYLQSPDVRIIHRDINPNNILLFSGRTAKLSDFGGSVKLKAGTTDCASSKYFGTHGFMADESAYRDNNHLFHYSFQSDVYGAGATFNRMLGMIYRHGGKAVEIKAEMEKCLLEHPNDRPKAEDVLNTLKSYKY